MSVREIWIWMSVRDAIPVSWEENIWLQIRVGQKYPRALPSSMPWKLIKYP